MESFVESGMTFGPFDDMDIFRIEKSCLLSKCRNTKTVEFIWKQRKNRMIFVEAKSSSPVIKGQKREHYEKFIAEITNKFVDSFNLLVAGLMKRRTGWEDIPTGLTDADYPHMEFKFILIVKNHEETWLEPLRMELEKTMKDHHKIWNSTVIVMNELIAREKHLVT